MLRPTRTKVSETCRPSLGAYWILITTNLNLSRLRTKHHVLNSSYYDLTVVKWVKLTGQSRWIKSCDGDLMLSIPTNSDEILSLGTSSNIYPPANLLDEAKFLHRQFFFREAPERFCEQYILAHSVIRDLDPRNEQEFRTMKIIIQKNLDALGIEIWLRKKSIRHLLSCKILLIAYLAECDGSHPEIRSEANGRFESFLFLTHNIFLGSIRLLKGWIQKAWYGLL